MEIRIPAVGESVHEALLAKWFKQDGEAVKKDDVLCEIETDKITLDLNADADGILSISVPEGATVLVGAVIGTIAEQASAAGSPAETAAATLPAAVIEEEFRGAVSSPAARREMREQGIAPETVAGSGKGGRITLDDLFARIEEKSRRPAEGMPAEPEQESLAAPAPEPAPQPSAAPAAPAAPQTSSAEAAACVKSEESPEYTASRDERRPMSPIRRRIAERLLAARQQTAMLTTFNEADLTSIKALREKHGEHIRQRHGVALGYMSFFVKACVEALREFPAVNASIDGEDIVYHNYYDIGIAIGAEKGLVVPVLRNADRLRLYQIEQAIAEFLEKIKGNRLAIADLEGGTFSITNGGIFGSMLSTPILNPPQSGILGMHAIQERPVARDGQVVIRPMMYLALSYDHRIIDGREAVLFLRKVREYIEEPEELLLEG